MLEHSEFEIWNCFEFRVSDFEFYKRIVINYIFTLLVNVFSA
jgi:hypothetical protein